MGLFSRNSLIRQSLLRLLGFFGIRAIVWRTYCRWFGPEGGMLQVELGQYRAKFYVNSQLVLRDLKTFGDERDLLLLLCSKLQPGDVVYDVGANMGTHAVFFSQVVGDRGQVIAFEPEAHFRERLRANIALNGLSNIRPMPVALGDRSYTTALLPSKLGAGAPRVVDEKGGRAERALLLQKVRVVSGDELMQEDHLPTPRLIKIDVEGFEQSVLQGLTDTLSNPSCNIVCCEVHPKFLPEGVGAETLIKLLRDCGFTRFEVRDRATEQHLLAFKDGTEARSS